MYEINLCRPQQIDLFAAIEQAAGEYTPEKLEAFLVLFGGAALAAFDCSEVVERTKFRFEGSATYEGFCMKVAHLTQTKVGNDDQYMRWSMTLEERQ